MKLVSNPGRPNLARLQPFPITLRGLDTPGVLIQTLGTHPTKAHLVPDPGLQIQNWVHRAGGWGGTEWLGRDVGVSLGT